MTHLPLSQSARRAVLALATLACALAAGCASAPPDYAAVIAAPDRAAADRQVDERRRQPQLLEFTGVRRGMRVLEMGAGGGYTTELLARVAGPYANVFAQDPPGLMERAKARMDERMASPSMKYVVRVTRAFDDPIPPQTAPLDLITFLFAYHDVPHMSVNRAVMNRKLYEALAPGGVLIVADHSARPGTGTTVGKTLHRIDEAVVREEFEAVGFKLVARGEFLRNPADPRDTVVFRSPVPVDEFVLKFVKPR